MRIALVLAIAASAACFRAATPYPDNYAVRSDRAIQARTTDGDDILVRQDSRSGVFYIVAPESLSGQPVAIVNDRDTPMLVTRDVRVRRHYVGSGGEVEHRDDRHHDDDRDHR